MYSPRHKKEESAPLPQFKAPQQSNKAFTVPELAPDDKAPDAEIDGASGSSSIGAYSSDVYDEAPVVFEIPELVPDEEPVTSVPLESTSAGVLGFNVSRRPVRQVRRQATLPSGSSSTMYSHGKQRSQELEYFAALSREREVEYEQAHVAYALSRQALSQTIGRAHTEDAE